MPNQPNQKGKQSLLVDPNPESSIKKIIGVVSGKGGVGKSLVSSLIASCLNKSGEKVGILDGDVTGPSIPKMFGMTGKVSGDDKGMYPLKTDSGIDVMSINLLLPDETSPVIWRGPVIGGVIRQFWADTIWKDIDDMIIDMPPGTGDVPLSVFQMIPVDGIIIVSSPQDLVSMIVQKAVKMAKMMKIPILGIVENMSYLKCPNCGEEIPVFGKSHVEETAAEYGFPVLAKIPIDPQIATLCDVGRVEDIDSEFVSGVVDAINKIKK